MYFLEGNMLSCVRLCNSMDCSPPGSSIHGILQARILEWVALPSSRGSSQPSDRTRISYVSCTGRRVLSHGAAREALGRGVIRSASLESWLISPWSHPALRSLWSFLSPVPLVSDRLWHEWVLPVRIKCRHEDNVSDQIRHSGESPTTTMK